MTLVQVPRGILYTGLLVAWAIRCFGQVIQTLRHLGGIAQPGVALRWIRSQRGALYAPAVQSFLLILGDRDGLAWVLENQAMAFADTAVAMGTLMRPGDELLLYTSRGCFNNPTRDRGRVIGRALVLSPLGQMASPVQIGQRRLKYGLELKIKQLAPFGEGVVLASLVDELEAFPNKRAWSSRLRRTVLPLAERDAHLIRERLQRCAGSADGAHSGYLAQRRRA